MTTKAKNLKGYTADDLKKYVIEARKLVSESDKKKVTISVNNRKMNHNDGEELIASVSISPILTCHNCSQCSKFCYALKMAKLYSSCNKSWANNLAIWKKDPESYFNQISTAAKKI